jgi:hypothetical protein
MSAPRLNLPCPECGAKSRGAMTVKNKEGQPVRYRKCDNGHRFVVEGGPALVRSGPIAKGFQTAPPQPLVPTLTEWRHYPSAFLEPVKAMESIRRAAL